MVVSRYFLLIVWLTFENGTMKSRKYCFWFVSYTFVSLQAQTNLISKRKYDWDWNYGNDSSLRNLFEI